MDIVGGGFERMWEVRRSHELDIIYIYCVWGGSGGRLLAARGGLGLASVGEWSQRTTSVTSSIARTSLPRSTVVIILTAKSHCA